MQLLTDSSFGNSFPSTRRNLSELWTDRKNQKAKTDITLASASVKKIPRFWLRSLWTRRESRWKNFQKWTKMLETLLSWVFALVAKIPKLIVFKTSKKIKLDSLFFTLFGIKLYYLVRNKEDPTTLWKNFQNWKRRECRKDDTNHHRTRQGTQKNEESLLLIPSQKTYKSRSPRNFYDHCTQSAVGQNKAWRGYNGYPNFSEILSSLGGKVLQPKYSNLGIARFYVLLPRESTIQLRTANNQ